jgi:uncharacterized protein YciI
MHKYVALYKKSDKEQPREALLRHVEHLRHIKSEGKLFACGPLKDTGMAMQIFTVESYEEADALAKQDPYTREGYFSGYVLTEWIEANEENNYLL